MALPKLVILISGNGSNLQAFIDSIEKGDLKAEIQVVISNKKSAYGLERAAKANIPTLVFPLKPYKDAGKSRIEYDVDLANIIKEKYNPDLIVLAGWMHILSAEFLDILPDKIINLHPALPGQFDGTHAIQRAYKAFMEGKIPHTGVMVHKVIPQVDRGETILTRVVPIYKEDTEDTLEERIHNVEHEIIVEGAKVFLKNKNLYEE